MNIKNIPFNGLFTVLGTATVSYLGGWDMIVKALVYFMIIDLITGVLVGAKQKKINSNVMFWGGIKKGLILLVITIAVMLDGALANPTPIFRTMSILFYLSREGLSITENCAILGVPLPLFLIKVLEQVQKESNEGNISNKK